MFIAAGPHLWPDLRCGRWGGLFWIYIALRFFFLCWEKTVCSQCRLGRLFAFSHFPCPRASIATLKRSGVLPLGGTLVQNIVLTKTRCFPTWLWKLLKTLVWKPLWVQVFSHLALKTIENLGLKTTVSSGVLPLGFENYWKPCFWKPLWVQVFSHLALKTTENLVFENHCESRCSPTWRNTCQRHCFGKIVNFDKNKVFFHLALKTIENLVFENLAFENLVFKNHCEFRCSPTWLTGTSSFAKWRRPSSRWTEQVLASIMITTLTINIITNIIFAKDNVQKKHHPWYLLRPLQDKISIIISYFFSVYLAQPCLDWSPCCGQ